MTLKLIIVLIPGVIGTMIMSKLIIRKDLSSFMFVLNAIIIGLLSYLVLQLAWDFKVWLFDRPRMYKSLTIWDTITDTKTIPYEKVIGSTIAAIIISFIASAIDTHKIINRIAQRIGFAHKYGDENLFSYFLNAKETQVVYVRDIKNNLTYHGYVRSYSETEDLSEIVLSNVIVYRYEDSEKLYEVDQIYLSFTKANIIIEHAKLIENGKEAESKSKPEASK